MVKRLTVIITMPDDFPINDFQAGLEEQLHAAGPELSDGDVQLEWNFSHMRVPMAADRADVQRTVSQVAEREVWHRQELIEFMRMMGWYDAKDGTVRHDSVDDGFPTYYDALKSCVVEGSGE
jgi:hypothetical protein